MDLPKYNITSQKERIGVHKVGLILSEMGLIFRETSNSDTGVDGQLEDVDDQGHATGRIMAVQIKSGSSYLYDQGSFWRFYVDNAHENYWRLSPIPVMLLVYNPEDDNVYFLDVKYSLNTTGDVCIPKNNILCLKNKNEFLKTIGGSAAKCCSISEVFDTMLKTTCNQPDFSVSFLELFALGLTNLCHDLYFDISLASDIADFKSKGIGISPNGTFLWKYINYLVKENLVELNFHSCLYDFEYRKMIPMFLAPLTYRGRELLDYISKKEMSELKDGDCSIVCESFLYLYFDVPCIMRLERLSKLKEEILKTNK